MILNKEIFYQNKLIGHYQIYNNCPDPGLVLKQIHSNFVVDSKSVVSRQTLGDGIVWSWDWIKKNPIPIITQTADCLPVLILGQKGGALVHAGWRGVQKKIFLQPQIEMIEPTYFYIGPSIQAEQFEVDEGFRCYFSNSNNFFYNKKNKLCFNLQKETEELIKKRFAQAIIEDSTICTFLNNQYNSYRREKKLIHRNWNVFKYNNE